MLLPSYLGITTVSDAIVAPIWLCKVISILNTKCCVVPLPSNSHHQDLFTVFRCSDPERNLNLYIYLPPLLGRGTPQTKHNKGCNEFLPQANASLWIHTSRCRENNFPNNDKPCHLGAKPSNGGFSSVKVFLVARKTLGIQSPNVSGWLGCPITSSAKYLGSITILRRWLDP